MKLKELRKKEKLTQNEVAKILNTAQTTYSGYESESSEPNIATLIKLADFYKVSLDYLCEHKTTHLLDTSSLNDNKKEIINLVEKLSEKNDIILLGYLARMLQEQNS